MTPETPWRRHTRFFQSRLARRIVLLFFVCAMLPVAGFSLVSFHHVSDRLKEQSRERLSITSKELGMSMLQRLHLAEAELRLISAPTSPGGTWMGAEPPPDGTLAALRRLTVGSDSLATDQRAHLRAGRTVLDARPGLTEPIVRLGRAVDPSDLARGVLWAEIELARLWGGVGAHRALDPSSSLRAGSRLCVWTEGGGWPDCPPALVRMLREASAGSPGGASREAFAWSDEGTEYLAGRWHLHLRPSFLAPAWHVVLSQPREDVFAPMADLRRTVALVVFLALLVVLFLSQVQIRRNLEPLEKLKEATRRIARREFESRVEIASGDEFEELATAFNGMSQRLGRQFGALLTTSDIDRAILGSLDIGSIVDAVLRRGSEIVPGARAVVTFLDPDASGGGWAYHLEEAREGGRRRRERVEISTEEASELLARPEGGLCLPPSRLSGLPARFRDEEAPRWLLFPVSVEERLAGTLAFRMPDRPVEDEDFSHGRRLAKHVAVALANARLIQDLDRFNLQTLAAFARTIDAKSEWTAGHSERVTRLAVEIGQAVGLDRREREILRRGALVHDIGKIGVPGAILDKPGKLTEEEMAIMKNHTVIGARIIGPISRFERLVPIVRQHHERFDGKGYPDGKVGEAIDPLARIVAVADVYDALTSARPYRAARPAEMAVEFIREERGTAFDPLVVDAFLTVAGGLEDRIGPRRSAGFPDTAFPVEDAEEAAAAGGAR